MRVFSLLLLSFFFALPQSSMAQDLNPDEMMEDDMASDGDIFNDFNEDVEASQVLEDERFYRYGRFFQANIGLGITSFDGNRGNAYRDNHPTFHISTTFFLSFQAAIVLGIEYSKHTMILDSTTRAYKTQPVGLVETAFTRPFLGFRYYVDTTDLGTALTYSNPHFIARVEYWYQTNKFLDNDTVENQKGGGIGTGIGGGLEFPIELKKSYVSVEALFHVVNFFDKFTQDYRQDPTQPSSTEGYDNLQGNAYSLMMTYNFTW